MAGRAKQKVYEYYMDGTLHKVYESMAEYRETRGLAKKFPLFRKNTHTLEKDYEVRSSFIIFKTPTYRDIVKKYVRIHKSPYCKDLAINNKAVEAINLRGEVVATFTSAIIAINMLPKNETLHIYRDLNSNRDPLKYRQKELFFRYKE